MFLNHATTELDSSPPLNVLFFKHIFVCANSMVSDFDPARMNGLLGNLPLPPAQLSPPPPTKWKPEQLLLLLKYLVVSFPRQEPH